MSCPNSTPTVNQTIGNKTPKQRKTLYIATALQLPKDFKSRFPHSYSSSPIKEYVDRYYEVVGEEEVAKQMSKEVFEKYLYDRLELLMPSFPQTLLTHRNVDFVQDKVNSVICLSLIPLGNKLTSTSLLLAPAFCEAFVKLPQVFGSGIVEETIS